MGYSRALNSKNRLQRLQHLTKVESFLMWSVLPKAQRRDITVKTLPCEDSQDTPSSATEAITTGGVSLLICKNILFGFHTPPCGPRPQKYSNCRHSLQLRWWQWEYRHLDCSELSNIGASQLFASSSLQKHSNFQVTLLPSLPIKVEQCLNMPLSFWQRTPHKKDSTFFRP